MTSEEHYNEGQFSTQIFRAHWDEGGVWFYQAFGDEIADWALENQRFGGPGWNPTRMTWIKPSFGWMLYRAGYGRKGGQNRILKIKIGHEVLSSMLSRCTCGHGRCGAVGRIQWDPERDLSSSSGGKEPRRMLRSRSIQIGLSRELSQEYSNGIIAIEEVTDLAHRVQAAHETLTKTKDDPKKSEEVVAELISHLPTERPYTPMFMTDEDLAKIGMDPLATRNEGKQLAS